MVIWQSLWYNGKTETKFYSIQKKVGRGKEGMFLTGKHGDVIYDVCYSQGTIIHAIESCKKCHQERQKLAQQLEEIGIPLDTNNILQRNSGELCFISIT